MGDPTNPHNLINLPDELLVQILEILPASRDLCALCRVSKRMNKLADPVLHKKVLFHQPHHHLTFSESLATRPRRGSLILDVRVDYPSSALDEVLFSPGRVEKFSHTISTMSNLENLVVSVPESLCHALGTLFNGPFDLACLKTCSLFYQREDDGYWDLQENIHIFSHPTLEALTIRRAKLDERGFESVEQPSETALLSLHLIECDINDDALSELLLFPEALKEITITQLDPPSPETEESPHDVADYVLAMQSAQHSLESISLDFATLRGKQALRFREFDALRTLELRDYQLFGQSRESPRLHSVGLPPKLENLKFIGKIGEDEEVADLLCYTIEQQEIGTRDLCRIVVEAEEDEIPKRIIEACENSKNFELYIQ